MAMSHQGIKPEMKTIKSEAANLEPLANKRIESNKPLTLAYRNCHRRAPPKQPQQSHERKQSFLSPSITDAIDESLKADLTASLKALDLDSDRKRKRINNPEYTEDSFSQSTDEPCRKRRRIRTEPFGSGDAAGQQLGRNDRAGLVYHWILEGRWPKHYFEPDEGMSALLRMHRLMMSLPSFLVQQSDVADTQQPGIDPLFLIT